MSSKSDIAVSVRGLSKSYTIAHKQEKHSTLAETLLQRIRSPFKKSSKETFWALKDISFEIKKGEVVGIIGRNGAGKSTLLKILSRITQPTNGVIDLYGRIGSLLEVGTGFHPELTGRENVYLNGQILGMRKREVDQQFDAIVNFSGVENFLDTPVKRYSSGMYVRLAFAVAAHLETEILVVDEVLAVGDAEFQSKCIGKMKDVATGGRTVLFVSHHMQSVQTLCNRSLYLQSGVASGLGTVQEGIESYTTSFKHQSNLGDPSRRPGTGDYRIMEVKPRKPIFDCDGNIEILFRVERIRSGNVGAYLNVGIMDSMGVRVATCDMRTCGATLPQTAVYETTLSLKSPWLRAGEYRIFAAICNHGTVDIIEDACRFTVSDIQPYQASIADPLASFGVVLSNYQYVASS